MSSVDYLAQPQDKIVSNKKNFLDIYNDRKIEEMRENKIIPSSNSEPPITEQQIKDLGGWRGGRRQRTRKSRKCGRRSRKSRKMKCCKRKSHRRHRR